MVGPWHGALIRPLSGQRAELLQLELLRIDLDLEVKRLLLAAEQDVEGVEAAPVERGEAALEDGHPVLSSGVSGIAFPTVAWIARGQLHHHPIAHDLRHDR